MSTRDMEGSINDSYKLKDGDYVGHYMPLLAEVNPEFKSEYGGTLPHVGSVLIVNDNEQNWDEPCNIDFEYDYAEVSGWITGYVNGIAYEKRIWKEGGSATGTMSIQTGTRMFAQHLFTDSTAVYNIRNINVYDPLQDIKFYMLADNGIKLIYGMNNERNRNDLDKIIRFWWVAPPECLLCDATGIFEGDKCPQCGGVKYIGKNAEGYLLTRRAAEIGVRKRNETDQSFQHRAWAKKQWVMPNEPGIRAYVSTLTGVPVGEIDVTPSTGMRELKFYVGFPLGAGGTENLEYGGTSQAFVFPNTESLQEVLNDVAPAGTNVIINPYYKLTDASVMEYQNGYANPIQFGMQDGRKWYTPFHITGESGYMHSGRITSGYQMSGNMGLRWFESTSYWDTNDAFYGNATDKLTTTEYDEIYKYDNGWVITGTAVQTGYYTGTYENNFTGIFMTGGEIIYR